jgi:hypothetical protein
MRSSLEFSKKFHAFHLTSNFNSVCILFSGLSYLRLFLHRTYLDAVRTAASKTTIANIIPSTRSARIPGFCLEAQGAVDSPTIQIIA